MRQAWYACFGTSTAFPKAGEEIYASAAELYLSRLARPYPGKKAVTIEGATRLLASMRGGGAPVSKIQWETVTINRRPENGTVKRERRASAPLAVKGEVVPQSRPEKAPEASVWQKWVASKVRGLAEMSTLEWVYYTGISVTCYAIIDLLAWVGALYSLFYFLASRKAMNMAKDRRTRGSAGYGVLLVFLMELAAWFLHFPMFNSLIWDRVDRLPWKNIERVADPEVQGLFITQNTVPGTYAFFLSTFMSLVCFFAVWQTLNLTKERAIVEDWKRDHGTEY